MMHRHVIAGVAALALITPRAVVAQEPVDRAMIERLRAEGRERSQVLESYRTLTDVIGPRLTGTPGYRRAVDWARGRLTERRVRRLAASAA